MATFYGGAQLQSVTSIGTNNGTENFVIPNGSFGIVKFFLKANDTGDQASISIGAQSVVIGGSSNSFSGEVSVTQNVTVQVQAAGGTGSPNVSAYASIEVYKNP